MRSVAIMFILFVASITSAIASSHLSPAQWSLMKNDPAIAGLDSNAAAAYYKTQYSPATKAWITSCPALTLDEGANYSTFDSIVAGKRAAWDIYLKYAPRDLTKAKNRAVITDVWGNATASSVAESILQAGTRNINNIEKLLGGTATATTGTVTALKLTWEGTVNGGDVNDAREFGL